MTVSDSAARCTIVLELGAASVQRDEIGVECAPREIRVRVGGTVAPRVITFNLPEAIDVDRVRTAFATADGRHALRVRAPKDAPKAWGADAVRVRRRRERPKTPSPRGVSPRAAAPRPGEVPQDRKSVV